MRVECRGVWMNINTDQRHGCERTWLIKNLVDERHLLFWCERTWLTLQNDMDCKMWSDECPTDLVFRERDFCFVNLKYTTMVGRHRHAPRWRTFERIKSTNQRKELVMPLQPVCQFPSPPPPRPPKPRPQKRLNDKASAQAAPSDQWAQPAAWRSAAEDRQLHPCRVRSHHVSVCRGIGHVTG